MEAFSFGTEQTAAFMKSLKEDGTFTLTPAQLDILEAEFGCSSCDDQSTAEIIKRYFDDFGYLIERIKQNSVDTVFYIKPLSARNCIFVCNKRYSVAEGFENRKTGLVRRYTYDRS